MNKIAVITIKNNETNVLVANYEKRKITVLDTLSFSSILDDIRENKLESLIYSFKKMKECTDLLNAVIYITLPGELAKNKCLDIPITFESEDIEQNIREKYSLNTDILVSITKIQEGATSTFVSFSHTEKANIDILQEACTECALDLYKVESEVIGIVRILNILYPQTQCIYQDGLNCILKNDLGYITALCDYGTDNNLLMEVMSAKTFSTSLVTSEKTNKEVITKALWSIAGNIDAKYIYNIGAIIDVNKHLKGDEFFGKFREFFNKRKTQQE